MPGWAFHQIIQYIIRTFQHTYDIYHDFCIYNPIITPTIWSDVKKDEGNRASNIKYKKNIGVYRIPLIRSFAYRVLRILNRKGYIPYDEEGKYRRVHPTNQYDAVIFLDYYMDQTADFSHVQAKRTIRGIYTDGFPPKGIVLEPGITTEEFCKKYLNNADAVVVGSPSIEKIYAPYLKKVCFANMAYDETLFVPAKRPSTPNLTLGWTGNPNREFKGYHQIIVPAVEGLRQEGYNIELKSRFEGTLEDLVKFWQNVDVALIASEADAGPSLFMEACLCGVPSISTHIGMPEIIIKDHQNGLFTERSITALQEKIRLLYHNREMVSRFSSHIRNDYKAVLGEEKQRKNWENLFTYIFSDETA